MQNYQQDTQQNAGYTEYQQTYDQKEYTQYQQQDYQQQYSQQNQQYNYTNQNVNQNANDSSFTISTEDWVPLGKLIGLGESDKNDTHGCFERGKKIVPELTAPCEGEVPVKQYHICNARARVRGLWQEGRIQVTNKRIMFRLSGRSWIGRAMSHSEFDLNEIAGVALSNGVRFSAWDMIVAVLLSMILIGLGGILGNFSGILALFIGIALAAPFFVIKKKYFIKVLSLAAAMGTLSAGIGVSSWRHPFIAKMNLCFLVIVVVLYMIALILFALKPSLSIQVMTKCASDSPIYIWSRQTFVSILEILPGEDADVAIEELGAMIRDLQELGDAGIAKWKED